MVLKLYGHPHSSCTHRVAIVLHEKQVPFEFILVDIVKGSDHKSPGYLEKQPFGQIPLLDDDGFLLYESRAICRYIATKYADQGTSLIPTDPKARALFEQAASIEQSNFNTFAAQAVWYNLPYDAAAFEAETKKLDAKLDIYDKILSKQKYLAGNELTLADLFHLPLGNQLAVAGYNILDLSKTNVASTKWINVSEPTPHVLHVELARSPVNAYWQEYGKVFETLVDAHGTGEDIRVVVVSSSYPKIFSAGLDMASAVELGNKDLTTQDPARASLSLRNAILEFQNAICKPDKCPFPVIAAVHGPVVGLGIDLISACDVRYASSTATFSIKEVDVGLAPDIGTLAYLPKITGNLSAIRELTYTSRFFSAAEALNIGLVSKVVEGGREAVIKDALELAKVIAGKSPVAVAGAKHLINHARDHRCVSKFDFG
ncbi:hypothetical protein H0H93_012123, partial [Arthromyces matolae]